MNTGYKVIFSIGALALYGFFAMASFGSSNTEVRVGECKPRPSFTGHLTIDVHTKHIDGTILPNVTGTIFLVHQIIQDTMTCQHSVVLQQQISFVTDVEGNFQYATQDFTHTNAGDLWRVEVNIPPVAGRYRSFRSVQGAKYNGTYLQFDFYELQAL